MGFGNTTGVTLREYGTVVTKVNEVADCILARDYKGFGRQEMNGVLKIGK